MYRDYQYDDQGTDIEDYQVALHEPSNNYQYDDQGTDIEDYQVALHEPSNNYRALHQNYQENRFTNANVKLMFEVWRDAKK